MNIKLSPREETSRPWNFSSHELRHPRSLDAGDSNTSPVSSTLADDNDAEDEYHSPLFMSPGPPGDTNAGGILGLDIRSISPRSLSSNMTSGGLVPIPRTPIAYKRSSASLKPTREDQKTLLHPDDSVQAIKRRKVDIEALKAESEKLAKKKLDSARRVEEARLRREKHEVCLLGEILWESLMMNQNILNKQYEALQQERLEVLKSIAADRDAEKEYLVSLSSIMRYSLD